jgi:hypothetical protein
LANIPVQRVAEKLDLETVADVEELKRRFKLLLINPNAKRKRQCHVRGTGTTADGRNPLIEETLRPL